MRLFRFLPDLDRRVAVAPMCVQLTLFWMEKTWPRGRTVSISSSRVWSSHSTLRRGVIKLLFFSPLLFFVSNRSLLKFSAIFFFSSRLVCDSSTTIRQQRVTQARFKWEHGKYTKIIYTRQSHSSSSATKLSSILKCVVTWLMRWERASASRYALMTMLMFFLSFFLLCGLVMILK